MCNCLLVYLLIGAAVGAACYYYATTAPVSDNDDNPFDHF